MFTKNKSLFIALAFFHLLFLIILATNFPWGKWFIGWDSIHPEFDFLLNFKRALFAGWQGNYGVGALTGHGFAALLPHTLITFLLSLIMPLSAIRPSFTLLCFYFGGLGLFFLVKEILALIVEHFHSHLWESRRNLLDGIALLASLYYLFNLATVQIFYVQLEAFIAHFAGLPWLFLSAIFLIKVRSRKHILFFSVVNFLATIQGFIPSLFVAYVTGLALFLFTYVVHHRWSKIAIKQSFLVILLTFFINAYWLLPVAYFTVTRGSTFLNSYNNLISTPEFVQKSQKFGDLGDVVLLKGFYWDSYELGGQILSPWIKHQQSWFVTLVGYSVFGIATVGLLAGLFLIRNWLVTAFSFVGLYFFSSIAVSMPPFSWITNLLQLLSPTYTQAFRTTFTKFGLGMGFIYSILFSIGLLFLITKLHQIFKHKVALYSSLSILGISLILYALPLFQGNLIFKKLLVNMPQSYVDLMNYFKTQGDGRIADFPQDCPEGWYSYRWGYFGSGFLWYGIQQPILSRSFDVWSPYNENYYWELIQAIREQNFDRVDKIFDKYGVKWILYDQNFIYCRDQHGTFTTSDFIAYVESSSNYRLVKTFDAKDTLPIKLYERIKDTNSYVSTTRDLRNIGPSYYFNDRDNAYNEQGTYLTNENSYFDVYYPFRQLFSKRGAEQNTFEITSNENEIILTSQIPKTVQGYSIRLPAYSTVEKHVPIDLRLNHISGNTYEVLLTYQFYTFSIDEQMLGNPAPILKIGEVAIKDINNVTVYVNNGEIKRHENGTYNAALYFTRDNTVQIIGSNNAILFQWDDAKDERSDKLLKEEVIVPLPAFTNGKFQVVIPKIYDNNVYGVEIFTNMSGYVPESCDEPIPSDENRYEFGVLQGTEYNRMISQNSKQCLTIPIPELYTSIGYLFEVKSRHVSGGNLRMFVKNKNRPAGLDVYLSRNKDFMTSYFVMPATFPSEIGYDFIFQNFSFNNLQTTNDVAGVAAWYIPYNFLKNIKLEKVGFNGITTQPNQPIMEPLQTDHLNDTFYKISVNSDQVNYVLLSQGFDKGWAAFTPSFQLLSDHVLVNNWMNGWKIDQRTKTIYLFFLPQLLEWFGFLLLPIPLILVWLKKV